MRQRGFTYIGLLLLIAIGGIGLSIVGPVWHAEAQREREKELLFIGEQYARAIGSYYESTPGEARQYPATLEDLLEDRRFPVVRRHLRKLYRDPMTNDAEWGLILQQGRIVGVHSLSERRPVKQEGFAEAYSGFAGARAYREWRFTGTAGGLPTLVPSAGMADTLPDVGEVAPQPSPQPTLQPENSGNEHGANRYAACQASWAEENRQCRAGCGNPGGEACRSCIKSSFDNYRSCQRAN